MRSRRSVTRIRPLREVLYQPAPTAECRDRWLPAPQSIPSERRSLFGAFLRCIGVLALAFWVGAPVARAEDKAAGVFDDEKTSAGEAKPAGKDKEKDKDKDKTKAKTETVKDRDSIGFNQENVAAQMTELEERMFRLSEALQGLEPENASRLRLALKFSREELIYQQMKETQGLLKEAQLSKAETEVRELLAKLEHLRSLLLAEDLDFQMKLARLRQMKEALSQLERIIKEERRELAWSRSALEQQKDLDRMRRRRPDLEAVVRDQEALLADTQSAWKKDEGARKDALAAIQDREKSVRAKTAGLAADPLFSVLQPPHLKRADTPLSDALTHLGRPDADEAAAAEEQALGLLKKELARHADRIGQSEKVIAAAEFQRFEREQSRNRAAADALAQVSGRLGDTGVSLQKDLIRASGSMKSAEGELAKTAPVPAADHQTAAIEQLNGARDDLARAVEKLLVELRSELQARLVAELTEMHDLQGSIRETTEAQAPRVARRSRTALVMVAGLSPKQAELAERLEHLLALVEETEFGIALPTSLRVLSREMRTIEGWLKESDASARTVALEKRVEDDLLGLLEAMRRLPPTSPPPPGSPLPEDLRARERELNRLIAELKMIRLLQSRLNDDTLEVDKSRPGAALPTALRHEIEALESNQDEIHDSLAKISESLDKPEDDDPN